MTTTNSKPQTAPRIKGLDIPTFTDPHDKRAWMLQHMAGVLRVFGRKGFNEGCAGHVTIVDPVDPSSYWINPLGVHFSMISASDLVQVSSEGKAIGGSMAAFNEPGFKVHSALHKARPDVEAICHAHSFYARTYSVFGTEPEMMSQDSCLVHNNVAILDSYDGVGLDEVEGEKVAAALGDKMAVILQNHGVMTFGKTVDEAGYLHILLENMCKAQILANAAANFPGASKRVISDKIAKSAFNTISNPKSLYASMQPDYELEIYLTNGALLN
ncbi:LANO_0A02784g1_1 [Lachancea nothofagi CBS 11611]|uniref:LANO_0A02784g1_1 n=1 Tax=Lachancea nothofagi CBS 11611 TaxID=1266666 RepID=A0A1G4INY9_9SACH|nr:LANO_0A02784g1_1 [Lachancea nothofagi CBS 11611]